MLRTDTEDTIRASFAQADLEAMAFRVRRRRQVEVEDDIEAFRREYLYGGQAPSEFSERLVGPRRDP